MRGTIPYLSRNSHRNLGFNSLQWICSTFFGILMVAATPSMVSPDAGASVHAPAGVTRKTLMEVPSCRLPLGGSATVELAGRDLRRNAVKGSDKNRSLLAAPVMSGASCTT